MNTVSIFWFASGLMTALALATVAFPLLRRPIMSAPRWKQPVTIGLSAVVVVGAALGLYRLWGQPDALSQSRAAALPAGEPHGDGATGTARVGSVEDATQKLASRLKAQGGSATDWNLLAQSYDFLNQPEAAAEARKQAGAGAPVAAPPVRTPKVAELVEQGEKARAGREYVKAAEAYRQAAAIGALTADDWANYADATASAADGKLEGAPQRFIDKALQLDPDHVKALWLKGSALHEQKRYAEAIEVWRHLHRSLPADSADAKIVAQNIQEDERLGGAPAEAGSKSASISGTVDIDPALRAQASGATLFIFAQSIDSPGPPLAVTRVNVDQWPVPFTLSDAQAMLPERRLSKFRAVKVEARVSARGQPLAQAGDLQGASPPLDARDDARVHVLINKIIG